MNKISKLFFFLAIAGLVMANVYSAPVYSDPAPGGEPKIDPNKALVVFMRDCKAAASLPVPTFDITNDGEIFVGMPHNKQKSAYYCDPGVRLFMVQGLRNSFLEANLEAGRVYYVMLVSMDRFVITHEMRPIKKESERPEYALGSPEFKQWCVDCKWVESNDEARKFVKKRHKAIFKNKEYLQEWNSITGPVKKFRSLEPQDGPTE